MRVSFLITSRLRLVILYNNFKTRKDIDAGAVGPNTTDGWYNDSKGFRVKGIYQVSDKATLTAYQDVAETQAGADHNRTSVEFSVNF
jgi:hypothetical protein